MHNANDLAVSTRKDDFISNCAFERKTFNHDQNKTSKSETSQSHSRNNLVSNPDWTWDLQPYAEHTAWVNLQIHSVWGKTQNQLNKDNTAATLYEKRQQITQNQKQHYIETAQGHYKSPHTQNYESAVWKRNSSKRLSVKLVQN